jgi:hypothetical protein
LVCCAKKNLATLEARKSDAETDRQEKKGLKFSEQIQPEPVSNVRKNVAVFSVCCCCCCKAIKPVWSTKKFYSKNCGL